MKRFVKLIMLLVTFGLSVNVYAATDSPSGTTSVDTEQRDANNTNKATWDKLETNYKKGIISESVTGTKYVLIYGMSSCNNGSCTTSYANSQNYTFKDVLSRSVKCTGGEKYINYQVVGSGKVTSGSNNAYWSEEYQVVCTNSNSGSSVVELSNETTNNTGSDNNSGSQTTTQNTTTKVINSATTVDNEKTGINTYFVVLGLVGLISYIFMMCVKKYNLFKNI